MGKIESPRLNSADLFTSFGTSAAWQRLQSEAELEFATTRPEEVDSFQMSFRGRLFEEMAYLWLRSGMRHYRLLSPLETLEWTRERYPDVPLNFSKMQSTLDGVIVFDGLVLKINGHGEEEVIGVCEYGLNGDTYRHRKKLVGLQKTRRLPGVSRRADLIYVIPKEGELRNMIGQVSPQAQVFQTPFSKREFDDMRQRRGLLSPFESQQMLAGITQLVNR